MQTKLSIMAIALLMVVGVGVLASSPDALAHHEDPTFVNFKVDDHRYSEGDTIEIIGKLLGFVEPENVIVQIVKDNDVIHQLELELSETGRFSGSVLAEGELWNESGFYLVIATYNEDYKESERSTSFYYQITGNQ